MKGIVVYDTSHGNTRAVAEAITQGLKESGLEVDTFHVKDVRRLSAQEYAFLVLGSPTRFGTMSLTVKSFIGKVKSEEWANRPFAAFDTENPENMAKPEWSAAEKIAARLTEKKMVQALPSLKAAVHDWKGPLVDGESERARAYGGELARQLAKK